MRGNGRQWHGGRVLVCEDNLLMAEVVCEFLLECGLNPIGPVGHLKSAMRQARERALDGAVLDINLNGRPCFPVCAVLSARRIPFVFLTGYAREALFRVPVEYRNAPVISKPFEPSEMKEVLAAILGLTDGVSLPNDIVSTLWH